MKLYLNQSIKFHVLVAFLLGLWVYLFLVLAGPFDIAPLNMVWRAKIMTVYGVLFSLSYLTSIPLQRDLYRKAKEWTLAKELVVLLAMIMLCLPPIFLYYRSDIIAGEYSFSHFIYYMYLPSTLLVLPIAYALRRIRRAQDMTVPINNLVIKGENKTDLLQVSLDDLIAVKSAGNYVEVYFLQLGMIKKKLIRSSLKRVKEEVSDLLQVHRCYLINTNQPIEQIDRNVVDICSLTVPISAPYLKALENKLGIHP